MSLRIKGQFKPEDTICMWRWSYPVIMADLGQVRTCDKTINFQLKEEDFEKYGTDAFINHPYFLERRREKLDGLRHRDCFNCIILEDKGLMSSRTGEAPFVEWINKQNGSDKTFEDYKNNQDHEHLLSKTPNLLEISLSNQCNLKCVYCSSEFSTEWEREEIKFGDKERSQAHRNLSLKPESFDHYFWKWVEEILPTLERIIFIGGEPLVNKNFLTYLEEINKRTVPGQSVHERPIIQIISNFGIPNKKFDEFLDVVEDLSKNYIVHLEVSGESFSKKTEYIRCGVDWDVLTTNVHSTLKRDFKNFRFGLQLAINNLCITSLIDLFKWAWELQNEYSVLVDFKENIVVQPSYLSPYILDSSFLPYVDECIDFVKKYLGNEERGVFRDTAFGENSAERWQTYLPFMYSIRKGIEEENTSAAVEKLFIDFTKRIEKRRGMNFLEYFPEYQGFYEKCQKSTLI